MTGLFNENGDPTMKTQILSLLLATTLLPITTGCVVIDGGQENNNNTESGWQTGENNQSNGQSNNTTPQGDASFDAIFVSGHLGNYLECPDEGYSHAEAEEDAAFAPCQQGAECGGPLNCEGAQLTIKLVNDGMGAVAGVSVDELALLGDDGSVAVTLPVIDVIDVATGEVFDGHLDAGEELIVRIDYQGPTQLSEFISEGNGAGSFEYPQSAPVRVTFGADQHEDVVVETKDIEVLPSIVT